MTPEKLCELAREAMTHAYVPYSGYQVGAAVSSRSPLATSSATNFTSG